MLTCKRFAWYGAWRLTANLPRPHSAHDEVLEVRKGLCMKAALEQSKIHKVETCAANQSSANVEVRTLASRRKDCIVDLTRAHKKLRGCKPVERQTLLVAPAATPDEADQAVSMLTASRIQKRSSTSPDVRRVSSPAAPHVAESPPRENAC